MKCDASFFRICDTKTHFHKHIYRKILIHNSPSVFLFAEKNAFVKLASLKYGLQLLLKLIELTLDMWK